jgi:hypothetical protein
MAVNNSVLERVVVADTRPSVDDPFKGDTKWNDPKQVCVFQFRSFCVCGHQTIAHSQFVVCCVVGFWVQRALAIAGMRRILDLQSRLLILFGAHPRRAWDETDGKTSKLHGPVAVGAILLWCVIPHAEAKRAPYLLMDQRHPCCVCHSSHLCDCCVF